MDREPSNPPTLAEQIEVIEEYRAILEESRQEDENAPGDIKCLEATLALLQRLLFTDS